MKVLLIQGPKKTATSSLTGLLNCHPEIFVLFENYIAQSQITKYGNQLFERYPEARQFFRSTKDFGTPILDLFSYLKEKEPAYSYQYVGTKINSLDAALTQTETDHKIIFTNRDIRSWLVKESVIKYFRTDLDIVAPAMDYLRYTIQSAQYNHAFHFWLEDFITNQKNVINSLSDYLDLELNDYVKNWWENFGAFDEKDPKSVFKLDHVHHSSKVEPRGLDTQFKLRELPFWEVLNDLFDKYYLKTDYSSFSKDEIAQDVEKVEKLKVFAPLPYTKAYQYVDSVRMGFSGRELHYKDGDDKRTKKSITSKMFRLLKKKVDSKIVRN
ncbi:hypothetical protein [Rhodohalobacter sp. 614A]|uniref:hypothetical protein n=1 Tax=Rhodohalobacter sp. 614A TaxID=2908649 RepID=UPI001F3A283A|nr:hypothetical protein [Rhodohalobacter sp. 614A]